MPLRWFFAILAVLNCFLDVPLGIACLLCFLYFVGGAQNPDSY